MMPRSRPRTGILAGVLTLVMCMVGAGCSGRPHAPALGNEPVYENKREGFRFGAPDDWIQHAKAEVPPGKTEKERLLVNYQPPVPGKIAFFEVSLADLSESTDLAGFLSSPSFGVSKWRTAGPVREIPINGAQARVYAYGGRIGREEITREVTVFRRGERVYFFTGVYPNSDSQLREQVRRSAASVIWE